MAGPASTTSRHEWASAYDLFGNGKTAVKVTLGKYNEASSVAGVYANLNPLNRLSTTTTRSWTDANGNFTPDCDLEQPGGAGQPRRRQGFLRGVG